jgi:hypothetical protein
VVLINRYRDDIILAARQHRVDQTIYIEQADVVGLEQDSKVGQKSEPHHFQVSFSVAARVEGTVSWRMASNTYTIVRGDGIYLREVNDLSDLIGPRMRYNYALDTRRRLMNSIQSLRVYISGHSQEVLLVGPRVPSIMTIATQFRGEKFLEGRLSP